MVSEKKPASDITVRKISREILSPEIYHAVESVEIEIWEQVQPGLSLEIEQGIIKLNLRLSVSTKKIAAWIAGVSGFVLGIVKLLNWLIPILNAYYNKSPPTP